MSTETPTKAKPKNIITDITNVAKTVEQAVVKEARVVSSLFAKEEPAVQDALKKASSYVQVIKTTLSRDPLVVEYLLNQVDVNVTSDQINGLLTQAGQTLGIIAADVKPTLIETIASFQSHASQLPNDLAHSNFFTGFFNILGMLIAPGTIWQKVVQFGIYIYNTFTKKG